jgi:hypothetical protein
VPFLTKLSRSVRGAPITVKPTQQIHRAFSMAWRCSGESNEALINNLKKNGLIETERVKEAMMKVLPSAHQSSSLPHHPMHPIFKRYLTIPRSIAHTSPPPFPTKTPPRPSVIAPQSPPPTCTPTPANPSSHTSPLALAFSTSAAAAAT